MAQRTPVERRFDPEQGVACTFEEMSSNYAGKYKKKAIAAYWEECEVAKAKRSNRKKAGAKSTAEAMAEAKPKAKAKAKGRAKADAPEKPAGRAAAPAEEVLKRLTACTVIPVVALEDVAHAVPLAIALREGGIDVAEITLRTSCAVECIREVAQKSEGVCVGAGTVLTPEQVDLAVEAGADFIVSPGFDLAVARRCRARRVLYLPGVATPTEVMLATTRFKLKHLKFFPASCFGGVSTLKAFSSVFPQISFMPTGGVTEANIGDFLSLPNVMAAGGSWMVAPAAVKSAAESGNWSAITDGAKSASAAAHAAHKK